MKITRQKERDVPKIDRPAQPPPAQGIKGKERSNDMTKNELFEQAKEKYKYWQDMTEDISAREVEAVNDMCDIIELFRQAMGKNKD